MVILTPDQETNDLSKRNQLYFTTDLLWFNIKHPILDMCVVQVKMHNYVWFKYNVNLNHIHCPVN